VTAEEETFRRVFRFMTSGRQIPDEATLVLFIDGISGEILRAPQPPEA
jgi:hypothetical protein